MKVIALSDPKGGARFCVELNDDEAQHLCNSLFARFPDEVKKDMWKMVEETDLDKLGEIQVQTILMGTKNKKKEERADFVLNLAIKLLIAKKATDPDSLKEKPEDDQSSDPAS